MRIGQRVVIRLDAFPGLEFPGSVYSIGALATGGWMVNNYIRNIPVRIAIEGSDPRLIPDLSASADVLIEKAENILSIPFAAVHERNGRSSVWLKEGDHFEEREVTLGIHNASKVAILSGLKPDDQIKLN